MLEAAYNNNNHNNINYCTATVTLGVNLSPDRITAQVNDELFHQLAPMSRNLGQVDFAGLRENKPQLLGLNANGSYYMYRIGDAWAGRNVHAALYDALRLLKDY